MTLGSRPVFFAPPSDSPQMLVISEPEYVVGTARIGRPEVSAMALPKPMVEPPPTTTQQSALMESASSLASFAASTGVCITALSNTPANVQRARNLANHLSAAGRRHQQYPPRAKPLDFRRKIPDAADAEHHPRRQPVVDERSQNRSTQGRSSSSHVHALRCWRYT